MNRLGALDLSRLRVWALAGLVRVWWTPMTKWLSDQSDLRTAISLAFRLAGLRNRGTSPKWPDTAWWRTVGGPPSEYARIRT